jgi:hypothetical protein
MEYEEDDMDYQCKLENLFVCLDTLKQAAPILAGVPTQELVDRFQKLVRKNDRGMYDINMDTLNRLASDYLDRTMSNLVDEDMVSMSWDPEQEDFTYKLTEKGRRTALGLDDQLEA